MQNTYKHLLFDLDGTLTDPMEGITKSVQYALHQYGIDVADRRELLPFIGPPLQESFQEFYGFSAKQADETCGKYNEYFLEKGMYENKPYDGIGLLLQRLRESGYTLSVATTKPEPLARRILEHFGLARHFLFIGGDTMERTRSAKAQIIRYVMQACGITDSRLAVMIGDRKYDIIGAQANGMDSIGVLYGYGSREELTQAGATQTAEDLTDLGRLLGIDPR